MVPKPAGEVRILLVYRLVGDCIFCEEYEAARTLELEGKIKMEEKGWTITYIPWEDMEGKPRVAGRFKTTKEKDDFLESLYERDNGWLEEELATLSIINDYIVNELYLCVLHPNLIEYTADTKSQNANTKCVYYNYMLPR